MKRDVTFVSAGSGWSTSHHPFCPRRSLDLSTEVKNDRLQPVAEAMANWTAESVTLIDL